MRQKALLAAGALAAVLVMAAPTAFASPNLVNNGSFETRDFTGWTTGGNFEATSVTFGGFYAYSGAEDGTWYTVMGPVGSDGTLSQTLATTAGAHYTFSFWFASVGDDPSDFSAYWDGGTALFSQTDPNTGAGWTQFSFTVTGPVAIPSNSPSETIRPTGPSTMFPLFRAGVVPLPSPAASCCWELAC
jgi:hypothetical protein